jgi:hypothetical protein
MSDHGGGPQPVLADPIALPSLTTAAGLLPVGICAAGFLFAAYWLLSPDAPQPSRYVPASVADLGPNVVTPVDPANRAAVHAAIAAMKVPEARRQQLEREVLAGERRLGWIIVTDSMDPDGDTIAIEAGGIVQTVVLTKAWMPVPVLLDQSGIIGIAAVRDGESGGITLALATHGGPVNLRALSPGEHIEVAAQ